MDKNENNKATKTKSLFSSLVVPIATALVVGGTAPWWVELIKGDEFANTEESSASENSSRESEEPELLDNNSSIDIQSSEAIVSDNSTVASDNSTIASDNSTVAGNNSTIASDQAVVQQSYGSGSNISAGGDVHYNEAPESLEAVQDSVALVLKKGMPYEEGRQILIDKGWQPITPVSLGGFPDINDPTISYIFNERGYQEVEACSGTGLGFCLFRFSNGRGEQLSVATVDNQAGDVITVWSWSFGE